MIESTVSAISHNCISHEAEFFSLSRHSIKPPLKKVSKTAQQMEKIRMFTAKIGQMDYRQSLKTVTKKFEIEDKEVEKVRTPH